MTPPSEISELVSQTLPMLPSHLREWAEEHLSPPRQTNLVTDLDTNDARDFWLVTDHTGHNDASYRVVFDPVEKLFGLEMTIEDGRQWFMGIHGEGTFADCVVMM